MKKVTQLDESIICDIGHAFGYYDYGGEHGLITPSRAGTPQRRSYAAMCA